MLATATSVVLPGDIIDTDELGLGKKKLLVGPGLISMDGETACACKAGLLKHKSTGVNTIWVVNRQKRVLFKI